MGTGLVGAPACGDVMKLQIEVDKENKITNAVFKVIHFDGHIKGKSFIFIYF